MFCPNCGKKLQLDDAVLMMNLVFIDCGECGCECTVTSMREMTPTPKPERVSPNQIGDQR